MYRRYIICFLISIFSSYVYSQELKIDKIVLLETDNEAVTHPYYDNNRQLCALLKFYIEDLPGITFNSSYIINKNKIQYNQKYYAVYAVGGIQKITLQHNEYLPVTISFTKDFQTSIKSGKTYGIYVSTKGIAQKKTQTVVFNMIPRSGKIIVNHTQETVTNGILQLELMPGNYTYSAQSEYYIEKTGSFQVTDVTKSQIISLKLKARTAPVRFTCNVPEAKLYIDNRLKGGPGIKQIPLGKHKVRVVAEYWKDHTQELILKKETPYNLQVTLETQDTNIPIVIIAQGFNKPQLYIDNKEVPKWNNNGMPINIKQGKHLITVADEKHTEEKIIRINSNSKRIIMSVK